MDPVQQAVVELQAQQQLGARPLLLPPAPGHPGHRVGGVQILLVLQGGDGEPGQAGEVDQLVYFTCLPWFPVTALKNEKDLNPSDSVPRVAWGRWEEKGARTELLLSLELNHRLLDGVHVGRFYEALKEWMRQL